MPSIRRAVFEEPNASILVCRPAVRRDVSAFAPVLVSNECLLYYDRVVDSYGRDINEYLISVVSPFNTAVFIGPVYFARRF